MSTVLLMTDTWHPTVLRIVPFSNNNARNYPRKQTPRGPNTSRGFPVLAVTRSGNTKHSASSDTRSISNRSVTPARSEYSVVRDNSSEISGSIGQDSEHTNNSYTSSDKGDDQVSKREHYRKYAKKKIPDMHSEMKEAIRFSVQDLNDQVSSTSSLTSTEPASESKSSKDKHDRGDNTKTKLPKPSLLSGEGRYYAQVNGVRRSVPLTPGELELERVKNNYLIEQAQKRKKYKLNINQLPRSTTPINDHDPDKLNMKQVIAFLQTKTNIDAQKNTASKRKTSETNGKVYRGISNNTETAFISQQLRTPSRITEQGISRSNSDLKFVDKMDNTRIDNTGCVSVLSTKSTPNLPYGNQSVKSPRKINTMSVRSYGERSSEKRPSKHKPAKEFKLYRFLAIAPDSHTPGLATTIPESASTLQPSSNVNVKSQKSIPPSSPRKFLRRKSRETTANILHRHAVNRNGPSSPITDLKDPEESGKSIRLPSMTDTGRESLDEDVDSCSTTSATCNSTKNSSKDEHSKFPKKGKCITFSDEKQNEPLDNIKVVDDNYNEFVPNNTSGFQSRFFKAPEFPKVNINGPRHIHINMPQEKGYSQEIVRLTLRQDKNATRVTSYMSDIQSSNSPQWHESERNDINVSVNSTSDIPNNSTSQKENKDMLEASKQLINTLSNNNFIKVRQKLKTTNLMNTEKQ